VWAVRALKTEVLFDPLFSELLLQFLSLFALFVQLLL
jgi:hypothetical protein